MKNTEITFGERLKQLRIENNMTQEELAQEIGISRSCIANYESQNFNPSIDILEKLVGVFNCSSDFLLGRNRIKLIENKKTKTIFVENFNRLLREKKITISKLAKDLNISTSTIYDNSTGKSFPRIQNLEKYAKYLGVEVEELLTEYEGKPVNGIETKECIIAIGQQLIERADEITLNLNNVASITIHAEITAGEIANFDVTKNYIAKFK